MHRYYPLALVSLLLCGCGGGGGGGGPGSAPVQAAGAPVAPAPVFSKLSGKVTDVAGRPLAGVTISVFHHNTNSTVSTLSDASGAWAVSGLDTLRNADYAVYAAKAGYGFVPAVADPAGVVGKLDFNGLYRTVLRFLVMPAHDVASASFTAYAAGEHTASLARTGQSTSAGARDDAALASGVAWPAQRFTDQGNGSVTDHLTGLVWLKNAGCLAPSDWAAALAAANSLASGACGLSDGSLAGAWRLPNINELDSLVDISQVNPALPGGHPFSNVRMTSAYWSSTTYMASTSSAMAIRLADGRWINGVDAPDPGFNNHKSTSSNSMWAVRSGSAPGAVRVLATGVYNSQGGGSFGAADDAALQLGAPFPSARFIDKGDGTVADTVTGLTWLKQADCIRQPWAMALASVNALASGSCGLTDGSTAGQWRMPNRAEMLSLSDRAPTFPQASYLNGQYQTSAATTGPVIFTNFIVSDYYWSSSTSAADASQAWTVYSCDFGVYNLPKSERRYSLAVR